LFVKPRIEHGCREEGEHGEEDAQMAVEADAERFEEVVLGAANLIKMILILFLK
jgi:hypothetical protein